MWLPTSPVFYRENQFSDDLTQTLAFYAYVALAVDYDSFGKQGGNPYIQRAYQVMNLAQPPASGNPAWTAQGDRRNRYWLIENLQSQQLLSSATGSIPTTGWGWTLRPKPHSGPQIHDGPAYQYAADHSSKTRCRDPERLFRRLNRRTAEHFGRGHPRRTQTRLRPALLPRPHQHRKLSAAVELMYNVQ